MKDLMIYVVCFVGWLLPKVLVLLFLYGIYKMIF